MPCATEKRVRRGVLRERVEISSPIRKTMRSTHQYGTQSRSRTALDDNLSSRRQYGWVSDSFAITQTNPSRVFGVIMRLVDTHAILNLYRVSSSQRVVDFIIVSLDGQRRRPEDSMYVLLQRLFPHRDKWTNDLLVNRFFRERFGLNLPLIDHQIVRHQMDQSILWGKTSTDGISTQRKNGSLGGLRRFARHHADAR